jgi:hypothetical protein
MCYEKQERSTALYLLNKEGFFNVKNSWETLLDKFPPVMIIAVSFNLNGGNLGCLLFEMLFSSF